MLDPSRPRALWLLILPMMAGCAIRVPPAEPLRDAAYVEATDPPAMAPYAPSPSYRGYVTIVDASGRRERVPR